MRSPIPGFRFTRDSEKYSSEILTQVLRFSKILGHSQQVKQVKYIAMKRGLHFDVSKAELDFGDQKINPHSIIIKQVDESLEMDWLSRICILLKFCFPSLKFSARIEELNYRLQSYRTEIDFYRFQAMKINIQTPKCYFTYQDHYNAKYLLLLEDLTHLKTAETTGFSFEEAKRLLINLAILHSEFWSTKECKILNKWWSWGGYWLGNKEMDFKRSLIDSFNQTIKNIPIIEKCFPDCHSFIESLNSKLDLIVDYVHPRENLTLIHGDYKVSNLLLSENNDVLTIDWQWMGKGNCATDVAYLLYTSLKLPESNFLNDSRADDYHEKYAGFRQIELELLEIYYEALNRPEFPFKLFLKTYAINVIYFLIFCIKKKWSHMKEIKQQYKNNTTEGLHLRSIEHIIQLFKRSYELFLNIEWHIHEPANEPILSYMPHSTERNAVLKQISEISSSKFDIPLVIGGKEIRNSNPSPVICPYNKRTIATVHIATTDDIKQSISASLEAWKDWSTRSLAERTSIFKKAADMLSDISWRSKLNAATIVGQGKNMYQAEIDSACELIDFWRFNSYYASYIETNWQPYSPYGSFNCMNYRPLEGFVFAASPFNFTAIGGNLATAPAIVGNTVVWKPSQYSALSNYLTYKLLEEAGLPKGVINFIPGDPELVTKVALENENLAGVHYTGSTSIFKEMYKMVGENINRYKCFPRLVGETGGKGFIFVHESADILGLATAIIRGGYEYSGQKCSAATRVFVPKSMWSKLKSTLLEMIKNVKMGSPEDPLTLVGPVIHQAAFDRCKKHIEIAKSSSDAEIIFGGNVDDSVGYFVEPTLILTTNPDYYTMKEEVFGPVVILYLYDNDKFVETLKICDESTPYGLTGAFWTQDRDVIPIADKHLQFTCGNYYINDKPTGAVVGQQPFGGGRLSGTNDKAGSPLNILRWVSARSFKESHVPTHQVEYPYMVE